MSDYSELADLVKQGLATPGIIEDADTMGAVRDGASILANVVGLALIAKVGLKPALRLSEEAAEVETYTDAMAEALECDADLLQGLADEHAERTAAGIAEALAKGTFKK